MTSKSNQRMRAPARAKAAGAKQAVQREVVGNKRNAKTGKPTQLARELTRRSVLPDRTPKPLPRDGKAQNREGEDASLAVPSVQAPREECVCAGPWNDLRTFGRTDQRWSTASQSPVEATGRISTGLRDSVERSRTSTSVVPRPLSAMQRRMSQRPDIRTAAPHQAIAG